MKTDKNSRTHDQGLSAQNDERAVSDIINSRKNGFPIRNCRQLRRAIAEGCYEFRLLLTGKFYSRKFITTNDRGRFCVLNYIDDSIQILTGRELYTRSNIGNAMRNGAFIAEEQSHV